MLDFTFKDRYDINDLLRIMAILRSPGGCPWDKVQTHRSIRKDFIEETYEVIEAINNDDAYLLKEELGDVLLQVVFHAQIESETGAFDFNDVCDGICKKLIIRHPHVFADGDARTPEEVLKKWDEIKNQTKERTTQTTVIKSVPVEFPALMRSQKVQKKAADVGFDWPDVKGALEKVAEETSEVREALGSEDKDRITDEIGDLLFSCVNVARLAGVQSEEALTLSTNKFIKRFALVEKTASEKGEDMKKLSLEELDKLWDEAKKSLNQ